MLLDRAVLAQCDTAVLDPPVVKLDGPGAEQLWIVLLRTVVTNCCGTALGGPVVILDFPVEDCSSGESHAVLDSVNCSSRLMWSSSSQSNFSSGMSFQCGKSCAVLECTVQDCSFNFHAALAVSASGVHFIIERSILKWYRPHRA